MVMNQRPSGQYDDHDDLTRVSRARSRAGRRGRSVATRHRRRATSRCSARMEPAVRSPRIEPSISTDRTRKVRFWPEKLPRFPSSQTALAAATLLRGTEFLDAETGRLKSARETGSVPGD